MELEQSFVEMFRLFLTSGPGAVPQPGRLAGAGIVLESSFSPITAVAWPPRVGCALLSAVFQPRSPEAFRGTFLVGHPPFSLNFMFAPGGCFGGAGDTNPPQGGGSAVLHHAPCATRCAAPCEVVMGGRDRVPKRRATPYHDALSTPDDYEACRFS